MRLRIKNIVQLMYNLQAVSRNWIYQHSIWFILGILFLSLAFFLILPLDFNWRFSSIVNSWIYSGANNLIFNNNGINDTDIQSIIKSVTSIAGFALSTLTALYVFIHREQKSVSPSTSNNTYKNHLIAKVVSIIIFIVVTGFILSLYLEEYGSEVSLHITSSIPLKITMWVLGLSVSIGYFIRLLKYLTNSLNNVRMIEFSIKDTSNTIDKLTKIGRYNYTERLITDTYEILHYNIESIFQNLKFTSNNNMNKDFKHNLDKIESDIFDKLNKQYPSGNQKSTAIILFEKDRDKFIEIYNSLLRNLLSLINHLYEEKHYDKGEQLVDLYFSLHINGNEHLQRYFMQSLDEFLDSIDVNDARQLNAFQTKLDQISPEITLSTYSQLLIKLIIENNTTLLTNMVYHFKSNVLKSGSGNDNFYSKIINKRINRGFKIQIIYILMQGLLKSIEISHYPISGFLVKFLITNFSDEDLSNSYNLIQKNPYDFGDEFERDYSLKSENNWNEKKLVYFNKETLDYCRKKMCILLYGQQYYACKENLWFITEKEDSKQLLYEFRNEFKENNSSSYIFKKVLSASSNYGLLFFNDEEVITHIRDNLAYSSRFSLNKDRMESPN